MKLGECTAVCICVCKEEKMTTEAVDLTVDDDAGRTHVKPDY
jgi:hypothetical protein